MALLVLSMTLTACAVPHKKGSFAAQKVAATQGEATGALARYREVRDLADELSDPKPLSTVEAGPLLAIDSGSFALARKHGARHEVDASKLEAFASPMATKYPLWFTVRVRDAVRGVVKVQVFERPTAVDDWLLVASPEILADTVLPALSHGPQDTIVAVSAKERAGLSMSPQAAVEAYARALADPRSASAGTIENDSFIGQMRKATAANRLLNNVAFSQRWSADRVEFAARTADGGVLVFANLMRLDSYDVKTGVAVTFPAGSLQQSFLGNGITTSGTLRYYHQILLYVPGPHGGKPRVLGQYGGVVSAEGS